MRKLLLFACALFGFMACTQNPIEEQSAIRTDAPETIRVGFEDDETRIQLNSAQKTVWTKGDLVSVFYRSNANQQWKYDGETGTRTANLKRVDAGNATETMKRVVVVYPYNDNYYINTETYNVQASLPATQHYLANSYGLDGNIMISSAEYNDVTLKNVCGWLKLQLTGDGEVVKSIKFRGNDGEQVAGELYINSADATAILASDMGNVTEDDGENATGGAGANLSFDDVVLTEVTLDCGEGVTLGKSATAFYIALPPQTFANGFTVEIEDTDGYAMEQSTAKTFVVERNTISPMAALEFVNPNHSAQPTPANNEIWYTNGSTTEATTPYETDAFGANIVSNTYDAAKECWVIKFDGKVTTIGEYAFEDCNSLTSVTIPDSVTTIGYAAFAYCSSLTSAVIGNGVTTIGDYAFCRCDSLTSVTIPDSVTSIGDYAFSYCISLTSVTIPNSVTTIGKEAFYNCDSLTSVNIPDGVIEIGFCAFCFCDKLTSVTIPDSVTTIGDGAFTGCSSLQEFNGKFASEDGRCLIIDGGLNYFAPAGLTEYTIPDSVTTIGSYAFAYCESLTSVTIPDSVTEIGEAAFRDCSGLESVYCKATTPPAGGSYMFLYNASGRKIYVPMESVEAYKSAEGWSEYAADIAAYDFENNVAITSGYLNGYEWVDLGLSVKWASYNVGATAPYECGDYFAWAEISPKDEYTEHTYLYWTDHNSNGVWDDWENTMLEDIAGNPEYDAAAAIWGGGWRMPTLEEQLELRDNCTWDWILLNDTNCLQVTGPNGSSIYIPAAGHRYESGYYDVNGRGCYWSSTPADETDYAANYLGVHWSDDGNTGYLTSHFTSDWCARIAGASIRPVLDK